MVVQKIKSSTQRGLFTLVLGLCWWGLCAEWRTPQLFAETPVDIAVPATIQTGSSPAQAYLRVNGRLLIDQPGLHLDRPQLSPDGKIVAVAVLPTGSETASLAQLYLFDVASGQLLATLSGHTPQWTADSTALTFHAAGNVNTYQVSTRQLVRTAIRAADETDPAPLHAANSHAALAPAYPQTIRVLHHANNGCRNEPAGQIDVISFEEYVARVVPAEMPAFWQFDALAAQAVAARTYAWQQILAGRPTYDVTDWANFQMMCDDRYPVSDAAAAQTAGQYLSEIGDGAIWPISAMYSAENGHPTLTNPNVGYLQAVPDLFALGKVRNGHGYGLSQWGAQRRALAGQNYRQILGHYYTNVYLQNATNPGQALGGLDAPLPGDFVTSNAIRWHALTPASAADIEVKLSGAGLPAPLTLNGNAGLWRAPLLLTEGAALTAELWVGGAQQDQLVLPIDTTPPPSLSLMAPAILMTTTLPLQIQAVPGALVGLSQAWLWQGETLSHTANSGMVMADAQAANHVTWQARTGIDQAGVWYGPKTKSLPPGRDYRALFWLRAKPSQALTPLARLDVTDADGEVRLGLRDLWASDFVTTTTYQPIAVDFHLFDPPQSLEFRVAWPGQTDLALDRVQIWTLPNADWQTQQPLLWATDGEPGVQVIEAAAFDPAGNLSQPVSRTVQIVDATPPVFMPIGTATQWISTTLMTVTATVVDDFSGLAANQATLSVGQQTFSATISAPNTPRLPQTLVAQVKQLADGRYTAYFTAADRAGNLAQSQPFPLWLDTTPPVITGTLNLTTTAPWFLTPVTLMLAATDQGSGLRQISYQQDQAAVSVYDNPLLINTGGQHQMRYWASDGAGNLSAAHLLTVTVDLTAPVVSLTPVPIAPGQVQLRWQAQDDASGVDSVELQTQQVDETWQPYATAPFTQTAGVLDFTVAEAQSLPVRMRATDKAGRISDWQETTLIAASAWLYLPLITR